MAERALQWVRTLASRARAIVPAAGRTSSVSGVQAIPLPEVADPNLIASLRLVPDEAIFEQTDVAGGNRRENERHACALDIEFSEDSHFFTGLSEDISQGGLFVATYERLPIGTRLSISFELLEGKVEARGEVRWVRDAVQAGGWPGLGIAFTELSAEAAERIALYCSRRPPLYVDV